MRTSSLLALAASFCFTLPALASHADKQPLPTTKAPREIEPPLEEVHFDQITEAEGGKPASEAKEKAEQSVKSFEELYFDGAVALEQFKAKLGEFQKKHKDCSLSVAALKGEQRAKQKIEFDYKGNINKLLDVVRASLVCGTYAQVEAALVDAHKELAVRREKNRFKQIPDSGYRDVLLNVAVPITDAHGVKKEHIAELQLHLEPIQKAKKEKAHPIYEQFRSKVVLDGNSYISRWDEEHLKQLNEKMRTIFDEAFVEAGGKVNK